MASLAPLGERLVVKPLEQEATTSSGIILPDTAKEKPQEGEVIAAGPVGDKIIYSKYAGTEYKVDGEEYLILRESDVLAKLT